MRGHLRRLWQDLCSPQAMALIGMFSAINVVFDLLAGHKGWALFDAALSAWAWTLYILDRRRYRYLILRMRRDEVAQALARKEGPTDDAPLR